MVPRFRFHLPLALLFSSVLRCWFCFIDLLSVSSLSLFISAVRLSLLLWREVDGIENGREVDVRPLQP